MRYYGGKHRIAEDIVALMPPHDVYVESFGGAASVLLAKQPAPCEIYNDLWGDVVNVFRQLRDAPELLLRGLFLTPYAREEYVNAYEPTTDAAEAARRFIFRSTAGYGSNSGRRLSGFRTTLDDGRYTHARSWANLPESLVLVCERLRDGVIIENKDAAEIMRSFDGEQTLHYVDPPYIGETRTSRDNGYRFEMQGIEQHAELLNVLRSLKGKVILSGYDSPLYREQLADWELISIKSRDQRNRSRAEMIWTNYKPEGRLL